MSEFRAAIDPLIPQIRAAVEARLVVACFVPDDARIVVGVVAVSAIHLVRTQIVVRAAAESAGDQQIDHHAQSSRKFFHCLNFHLRA